MRRHFSDSLTLYTVTGEAYTRHVIKGVSLRITEDSTDGRTVVAYVPMFRRDGQKYVPAEEYNGKWGTFTVYVGQSALVGESEQSAPPSDALSVNKIYYGGKGSIRMRHLRVELTSVKKEETTDEAVNT